MGSKVNTGLGTVEITSEVLSTLAGLLTMECYGVVGMAAKRKTDGIVELLGRDNFSRGVKLSVQENEINVDLYIMTEYGTPLSTIAKNVMDAVKNGLEQWTGLTVRAVNVTIESIKV